MRRRLILAGLAIAAPIGVALALPRVSPHLPHSLATVANLPEQLVARVLPPRVPRSVQLAGLTGAEREVVDALARRLDGRVVWSSNRTFIWPMGRPVSEAVRLTHHPGNDQWPDIYVPR